MPLTSSQANIHPESNDSKLWRLINNPAGFSEYLRSTSREQWYNWPSQIHELNREAKKKKRIQARNLGKTLNTSDEVISEVLTYRGSEKGISLIGARSQPTLQYVFDQFLVYPFQRNKFLNFFLVAGDGGVDRRNYEIRLRDGSLIKGRIQGVDGQGFNTVHPTINAWFEEVQLIEDSAIAEIYGMLSDNIPIKVTGVPNGVRSSWAYKLDTNPKLGFEGERLTRLDDPRTTEDEIAMWIEAYGSTESAGYRQKVLGEWGTEARMTFDMERITADLPFKEDERKRTPPWYYSREIHDTDYTPEDISTLVMIRDDMPKTASRIYIHADHGISGSPTTIYVSFYDGHKDLRCWRQYMRILLFGMQTQNQVDIFHYIAQTLEHNTKIKPVIGIDTTGQGGQAVYSFLESMGHPVFWAHFAENVDWGQRLENDEEYEARMKKESIWGQESRQLVTIKSPLKQIAIPHLRTMLYSGQVRLVNESALWKQLETTTDYETPTGRERKYETDYHPAGESTKGPYDHDLQAFEVLAAMLHRDAVAPEADEAPDMFVEDFPVNWGT